MSRAPVGVAGAGPARRAPAASWRQRRRPTAAAPPAARLPRERSGSRASRAALRGGGVREGRLEDCRLVVLVVEVPPLVGLGLRVALGRVLPLLLASERGDVEVAPRAAHRLVSALVDE